MPGSTYVFSEQIRDAITTEPSTSGTRKHRILRETFQFALPCAQCRDGILTQWCAPRFATFAYAGYVRSRTEGDVLPAEAGQL